MLYRFVKKDGNVVRIGDIDAGLLDQKFNEYLSSGYEVAVAEEHDAQVLNGSQVQAPAEAKSEPVSQEVVASSAPVEEVSSEQV